MKTLDPNAMDLKSERDGASIMGAGAARALKKLPVVVTRTMAALCEGRGSGAYGVGRTLLLRRAGLRLRQVGAAAATGRVAAATGSGVAAATGRATAATGMAGTTGTGGMSYCGVAEADGADERAVGEGITDADWDSGNMV